MRCRSCNSSLTQINAAGEPILRTRGLIFKAAGLACVCPKCKGDVPITGEMAKALGARLLLVYGNAMKS